MIVGPGQILAGPGGKRRSRDSEQVNGAQTGPDGFKVAKASRTRPNAGGGTLSKRVNNGWVRRNECVKEKDPCSSAQAIAVKDRTRAHNSWEQRRGRSQ